MNQKQRYLARWVAKDHFPEDDSEYNPGLIEYGEALFPATKEGLQQAINRVHEGAQESGVTWGKVHLQFAEKVDSFYTRWEDANSYEPDYYL